MYQRYKLETQKQKADADAALLKLEREAIAEIQ